MAVIEGEEVAIATEAHKALHGVGKVEESLEYIDYKRLVFGTDTVVHDVAWELGRLLSMDLPDEWLTGILGNNMKRILNSVEL